MHLHHHSLTTKIVAMGNKTVLLHECKRHTDCHLSSTPCAILTWSRGSTLGGSPGWGTPILTWLGGPWVGPPWLGYLLPRPGWGVPQVGPPGCSTPILTWPGGVPQVGPLAGVPTCHDLASGYPGQVSLARVPPILTWLGVPLAGPSG